MLYAAFEMMKFHIDCGKSVYGWNENVSFRGILLDHEKFKATYIFLLWKREKAYTCIKEKCKENRE